MRSFDSPERFGDFKGLQSDSYNKYGYSEKKPLNYKSYLYSAETGTGSNYKDYSYASPGKDRIYEAPSISPTKSVGYSKKDIEFEKKLDYNVSVSPSKRNKISSELAFVMEEEIALERRAENAKVDLSTKGDFNLTDGFRLLDTNGKGFITFQEFSEGLKDLGINTSGTPATLLFKIGRAHV